MSEFHDQCKQVILFHNNLLKFWKSLSRSIPEVKVAMKDGISYYKNTDRKQYISELHQAMEPHMKFVSVNDVGIFSNDYAPELYLMPKINFQEVWKIVETSEGADDGFLESTRISLFKHLQAVFISTELAMQQITQFEEGMKKQREFLMNMMENLKVDDEVNERMKALQETEANAEEAEGGLDFSSLLSGDGLGSTLDGFQDSAIYSIAQDLVNDLNLDNENSGEDPMAAITNLFANNGEKMQSLIQGIGQKLEEKIEAGEVDRDALMGEAQSMQSKISGLTKSVPGLSQMLNNMNPEEIIQQASQQFNQWFTYLVDQINFHFE